MVSVHLADESRTYVDQDDEVAESLEDKETVSDNTKQNYPPLRIAFHFSLQWFKQMYLAMADLVGCSYR